MKTIQEIGRKPAALALAVMLVLSLPIASGCSGNKAENYAGWDSLTLEDGTALKAAKTETMRVWGTYDLPVYTVEVPAGTESVKLTDKKAYFDADGRKLGTQYTAADGSSNYTDGYPWNLSDEGGGAAVIQMRYDGHDLLDETATATDENYVISDTGYLLVRVVYAEGATDPDKCYYIHFAEKK